MLNKLYPPVEKLNTVSFYLMIKIYNKYLNLSLRMSDRVWQALGTSIILESNVAFLSC